MGRPEKGVGDLNGCRWGFLPPQSHYGDLDPIKRSLMADVGRKNVCGLMGNCWEPRADVTTRRSVCTCMNGRMRTPSDCLARAVLVSAHRETYRTRRC